MDALKKQVGGEHYKQLALQPIEFITRYRMKFCEGNVVKYLTRNKGNRREDLEKAYHYLCFKENEAFAILLTDDVKAFYKKQIEADPFFNQFKNGKKYAQIIHHAHVGNKAKAKELLRKFINSGEYSEV